MIAADMGVRYDGSNVKLLRVGGKDEVVSGGLYRFDGAAYHFHDFDVGMWVVVGFATQGKHGCSFQVRLKIPKRRLPLSYFSLARKTH